MAVGRGKRQRSVDAEKSARIRNGIDSQRRCGRRRLQKAQARASDPGNGAENAQAISALVDGLAADGNLQKLAAPNEPLTVNMYAADHGKGR